MLSRLNDELKSVFRFIIIYLDQSVNLEKHVYILCVLNINKNSRYWICLRIINTYILIRINYIRDVTIKHTIIVQV